MLVKCIDSVDCNPISNSVSLVPRLEYSLCILDEIIEILKEKRDYLKKSNTRHWRYQRQYYNRLHNHDFYHFRLI